MLNSTDFFNILSKEDFEERPVTIEEFVQSEDFLGLPPLSDYQYTMVRAMSQVYKKSTLISLYGVEEGSKRFQETMNEVVLQLGKGSGKDYTSTIACAYIVYLLLCLKDPAKYYGKPKNDAIDILNIAINSDQAKNVFFKGFKNRIEGCPWFEGKFDAKDSRIEFDKSITVHSGHSEREAWEGYNVILVILDEISGFQLESTTGHDQAKTASAIYEMYRASVDSRFPEHGKVVLLSFPRFKGDYIQQRYNDIIANKDVVMRKEIVKLDPDLPDGAAGNEITVEWEEDHILSYRLPRRFAMKRPTWDVNPLQSLEKLASAFFSNPIDALSRFACMPPDAVDAFFKSKEKIQIAFSGHNGVRTDGSFREEFQPKRGVRYFIHVDLARKHDNCAVALAHVDSWKKIQVGNNLYTEPSPFVVVDAVRYWQPTKEHSVDFAEVREYILSLKRRGFDIRLVTFDRWESYDMMEYLIKNGMNAERLSVAKKHYEDFAMVIGDERLHGPDLDLLKRELLSLKIMKNDKIDHPRTGSKDLSDAVCGAIFNAVAHTPRNVNTTIEVHTYSSLGKDGNEDFVKPKETGVIKAPPNTRIPQELAEYMQNLSVI